MISLFDERKISGLRNIRSYEDYEVDPKISELIRSEEYQRLPKMNCSKSAKMPAEVFAKTTAWFAMHDFFYWSPCKLFCIFDLTTST